MTNKRNNALNLALLVFTFTVFPQRQSYAFVPAAVAAVPVMVTAFEGASTVAVAGLGALIAGMVVGDVRLSDNDGNSVRIPLSPSQNAQPVPPSAPATATGIPGASSYRVYGSNHTGSTGAESCSSWGAGFGTQCEPSQYGSTSFVPTGGDYNQGYCVHTWPCNLSSRSEMTTTPGAIVAPPGYTCPTTECVLTNPRQVTDDKTCDILLSNGQFATADDMNCPASADGTKLVPMLRDGKVIAYGTNSSGQPLMWEVSTNATQTTIKEYTQVQTATQTQVTTKTATIDNATSQVASVTSSVSPGSIASPSGATAPTANTAPTASNTPYVSTEPGTQLATEFPSDYARRGEAQTAANTIKQSIDPIKDKLENTQDIAEPTIPAWVDPWGATFNAVKGWTLPGHTSICPVGSFTWNNTNFSIDSHCTLINNYWGTLQAAMGVVWSIAALFIVLGA